MIELPPLLAINPYYTIDEGWIVSFGVANERDEAREARERILQARIAELEAVLVKFDERWLMDGELGFCVACGVSIEHDEDHKKDCWLSAARAAIDAARNA